MSFLKIKIKVYYGTLVDGEKFFPRLVFKSGIDNINGEDLRRSMKKDANKIYKLFIAMIELKNLINNSDKIN